MTSHRLTCTVLAILLLATGTKTRPVEIAKERFERQKPPISLIIVAKA
ncbi:MAG: hypothetical protein ABL904_11760 [Hyphomicrobiaceae bacterium]